MDLAAALKSGKKNSLTRDQAAQLYNDLQKNLMAIKNKKFAEEDPTARLKNQVLEARARQAQRPASAR